MMHYLTIHKNHKNFKNFTTETADDSIINNGRIKFPGVNNKYAEVFIKYFIIS